MTPAGPGIWCAIPVYNNAGTIVEVARQCREQIAYVLVIDDGSTDADLTELLKPLDVTVLRHPVNLGKGQALLTAFGYAAEHGAEYLITLDGDAQHWPADLPRFFPLLSPDTIVIGSREEISGQMPRASRFGREFSDFWIRLEAGGNARDTQSGFRAYPLHAVLQLKLRSHFYNFEMEILTKALWAGMRVESVPIHVWYPPVSQRVSGFDPWRDNLRISWLHTQLVLRQMLPIPHRKCVLFREKENAPRRREVAKEDAKKKHPIILRAFRRAFAPSRGIGLFPEGPVPLGVSAALSILMGIVLWPFGIFAVAYVAFRLHLNKIVALASVAVCMPPVVPAVCQRLGGAIIKSEAHPHLRWIVGSHLLAVPLAVMVGCGIYMIASRLSGKSKHEHRANHP